MPEHASLVLTAADDGRAVHVPLGAQLDVRLPENASTGFRWAVERSARRLLEAVPGAAVSPPPGEVGSAGTRTFAFRATAPGRGQLRFKLWRPWEGKDSIARRVSVTVVVEHPKTDDATD